VAWDGPSRERRILKAGHSSIAVTLPKPWAEAMNLRPGDLVVFDQHDDGSLFLKPSPNGTTPAPSTSYLVQARSFSSPGVLERLVIGAYRVGHDSIEIRSETPLPAERVEELLDAARGLLGVSVVAHEPNRIVLQNFIDPSKYGLPQLVQRMKMIDIATLEEAEEILRRKTSSRRLASLSDETEKVLALLVRQLFLASRDRSLARRIGSPDPRQLLEWRVVVHALQEISRLAKVIALALDAEPAELDAGVPELLGLLGELKAALRAVVETLIDPGLGDACQVHAEAVRLGELAESTARRLKASARKSGILAATLAVEQAAIGLSRLAELAVDRAVAAGHETILVAAP
jgi:phosphate uptake regulator